MRHVTTLSLFLFGILLFLSGCLPSAKTEVATLSGIKMAAPALDAAHPPDFENVDDKGYVRFKGTCLRYVTGFQIQIVHATGTVNWINIPSAPIADPRTSSTQAAYPLVASEYDTNCSTDGIYDFWIYISQVESWVGVAAGALPEIYNFNFRGVYGSTPSASISLPTSPNEEAHEANSINLTSGYIPVGIGICQTLNFELVYQTGSSFDYRVKNSANRSFIVNLGSFALGTNISIYNSQDCTGSQITNPADLNITIPANSTYRSFSYKVLTLISTDTPITATTSSFGTSITKSTSIRSGSAGFADHLKTMRYAPEVQMEAGDCERIELIATDANQNLTNLFSVSPQVVTAQLLDTTKFEFRTHCDSGGTALSSPVAISYTSGIDHMKFIFVKAKTGVTSADFTKITFSQTGSEFATLPEIFINPPKPVHHLAIERLDFLPNLFNHECYSALVELRSSSNASVLAPYPIQYKLLTSDSVQIFYDEECTTVLNLNNAFTIPAGTTGINFYWSRRQFSPLTAALSDTSMAGIRFNYTHYTPYVENRTADVQLISIPIRRSPLDLFNRGMQEIFHWYSISMNSLLSANLTAPFAKPDLNMPGSELVTGVQPVFIQYAVQRPDEAGSFRTVGRPYFNFNLNSSGGGVITRAENTTQNLDNSSMLNDGSAVVVGAYIYITDRSVQQTLFSGLTTVASGNYTLIINTDGSLKLQDSGAGIHCPTPADLIKVNRWTSVFLKIYRQGSNFNCRLYVNGTAVADSSTLQQINYLEPVFGGTTLGQRFRGHMLEKIADFDTSLNASDTRYADSTFTSLHNMYFELRYPLTP